MSFLVSALFLLLLENAWNVNAVRLKSDKQVLNICMDGKHHLREPTDEELYGLCKPWGSNSCCTNDTAFHGQQPLSLLYNLNLNHCGNLSRKCLRRFYINHCFYECTSNVGPWLKPVKSSIRNQRFYHVPLCKSDCDLWWEDCKDDFTCVDNFSTGFIWMNSTNHCPAGNKCRTFKNWFNNATNFCESIYPDDFAVVQNSSLPCMQLEFNGTSNPNKEVSKFYAKKKNLYLGVKTTITTTTTSRPTTTTHNHNETVQPYDPPTKTPILRQTGTIISIVLITLLVVVFCTGFACYKCKDAIQTRKRAGDGYLPSFTWLKNATGARTMSNRAETVDQRPFLQAGEEDDECAINPHGTLEINL